MVFNVPFTQALSSTMCIVLWRQKLKYLLGLQIIYKMNSYSVKAMCWIACILWKHLSCFTGYIGKLKRLAANHGAVRVLQHHSNV